MAKIKTIQQRFTRGEIDPKMLSRADLDQYFASSETMTNVFCIPQGGFRRRPGLENIDKLHQIIFRETSPTITTPNGGTGVNANDGNAATKLITTTAIGTINPYVIVRYDLGSLKSIAVVDVVDAKLSSGSNSNEFFIQVSTDDINWTSKGSAIPMSTSDITERRRVRGSFRYIRFARIGSTDMTTATVTLDEFHVWEETASVTSSRLIPFSFNIEQTYMLVVTDKNIAIYKNGVFQVDVRPLNLVDNLRSAIIPNLNWAQSADTLILVHEDMSPIKLTRTSDVLWTIEKINLFTTTNSMPRFDFVSSTTAPSATLTPSAVSGTINLTASAAVFSSTDVGQIIEGNGGRALIKKFTSSTVVKAVTKIPFFDTTVIGNGNWNLLSGFENVWSLSRGFPKSVTFHEGRLWFGGSKSRPDTLWGSRVGLFFDFDVGTFLDDDAIDVTLSSAQINAIVNIHSQKALQLFTTGGEFVVLQPPGSPITPGTINIKRQTSNGSKEGLRVQAVGESTVFIERGGKSIKEFLLSDNIDQSYISGALSLFFSHMMGNPVDFAFRKATSIEDANYLLIANSDAIGQVFFNGELIICAFLKDQNVVAPSRITTGSFSNVDGPFINCAVDESTTDSTMYFVIQRIINSVGGKYLERFNEDHFMDASTRVTTGLPTATFTGLDHLEGELCRVRADGSVLTDRTVTNGSVTIERNAENSFEIGLNFDPIVKDLPVEQAGGGSLMGIKKSVSKVVLRLFETTSIKVNGFPVIFREFGTLGQAPAKFTGDKEINGVRGWDLFGQITITQSDPTPMTVLAVVKEVET